jgi:hypothetical protein
MRPCSHHWEAKSTQCPIQWANVLEEGYLWFRWCTPPLLPRRKWLWSWCSVTAPWRIQPCTSKLGAVPASAKVVDRRRRGAIRPSHYVIERLVDRQRRPTHSRRHACHPAVPIQENRVRNLQSRDKSTTRNTLNREGLTLKSTRSADAAGLAPPAAPRLLWRPAAAVARTTSPFVSGAVPPTTASLWVIAAFGSLGVAGDGGSRDWKLGVTGDGRQENALLRWDRLGGEGWIEIVVYSMLSVRLHVRCPSCGACSSRKPGRSTLRGVRSWMKGDAEGRARRVQCAGGTLDLVSGFSRSQSEVWTPGYLFL